MGSPGSGLDISRGFPSWRDRGLVAGAAILYGAVTLGGAILCRLGFSLYEIALYPLALTHLMLLPILLLNRKYLPSVKMLPFFVLYGLIGALAELTQFGGLVLGVRVATVSFLLYTQPIWTSLFGRLLLNEKITPRKLLAVGTAFSGAFILSCSEDLNSHSRTGIVSAILGGVFIALWVVWGRKSGIASQHYMTTTLGWSGFSAAWLLLLWPAFLFLTKNRAISRLSFDFDLRYWWLLAAFALVAGILPSLLLFRGLQSIPASTAGVILLLEPISASVMAALLLHQPLGTSVLAGCGLVLLGNALLPADKERITLSRDFLKL
jgi:drug/metabolite transporter (DMT)-like permease